MSLRIISFAAIFARFVLLGACVAFVSTDTLTGNEPDPVVASTEALTAAQLDPGHEKEVLEQGSELFTHEWIAGDRRSHAGDGLGPVYNAQSCVACHRLGGIGGAGNNKTNVSLVTVFVSERLEGAIFGVLPEHPLPPAGAPKKIKIARSGREVELEVPPESELTKIHPILRTQPSFPLHRFGVGPEFAKWQSSIFPKDETNVERLDKQDTNRSSNKFAGSASLTLIESKRNTPPLFGAGLIDAIPDKVLEEAAAQQATATGDPPQSSEFKLNGKPIPVSGRVARLKDGRAGRFGWKANVPNLREFTLQACSSELGLEVPGFARAAPAWKFDDKASGIDLTRRQCDMLACFVASLPKPDVRPTDSAEQASAIEQGRQLFANVGCAACHLPKLGDVEGIYSDLLLHDMGRELSDSGSYTVLEADLASPDTPNQPRAANELEWRTPPLWGLRDSAPYLHDGRAATIADAVNLHGGEGLSAAQAYKQLTFKDRNKIKLFLQTLTVPAAAANPPDKVHSP